MPEEKKLGRATKQEMVSKESQERIVRYYREIVDSFDIDENIWSDLRDSSSGKYEPQDLLDAVAIYSSVGTLGNTSRLTGIPKSTLSAWKNKAPWWPALLKQTHTVLNDLIATRLTSIVLTATEQLHEQLVNGVPVYDKNGLPVMLPKEGQESVPDEEKEYTQLKRPFTPRELAMDALAIPFDKRALLKGDPTSKVEHVSHKEKLKEMETLFKELSEREKKTVNIAAERIE